MLQSDAFKKTLFGLTGIAAVLWPLLPPHTIAAKILAMLAGIGGGLGLVSGGTTNAQPFYLNKLK